MSLDVDPLRLRAINFLAAVASFQHEELDITRTTNVYVARDRALKTKLDLNSKLRESSLGLLPDPDRLIEARSRVVDKAARA